MEVFMSINKMYFSLSPNKQDIDIILTMKPKNILMSYAQWKNKKGDKSLKNTVKLFWKNDYYTNIMLDSGAYNFINDTQDISFLNIIKHTVDKAYYEDYDNDFLSYKDCLMYHINLIKDNELSLYYENKNEEKLLSSYPNLIEYLYFVKENKEYVNYIVALDDILNDNNSKDNWILMKYFFDDIIPTFHYGEDFDMLRFYNSQDIKHIGLGGIVYAKKNKVSLKDRVKWINECISICKNKKLHLFGCQDKNVLNKCNLYSADGTAWIRSAGFKHKIYNKTKFELACENIIRHQSIAKEE
jgi:hypothetical protein